MTVEHARHAAPAGGSGRRRSRRRSRAAAASKPFDRPPCRGRACRRGARPRIGRLRASSSARAPVPSGELSSTMTSSPSTPCARRTPRRWRARARQGGRVRCRWGPRAQASGAVAMRAGKEWARQHYNSRAARRPMTHSIVFSAAVLAAASGGLATMAIAQTPPPAPPVTSVSGEAAGLMQGWALMAQGQSGLAESHARTILQDVAAQRPRDRARDRGRDRRQRRERRPGLLRTVGGHPYGSKSRRCSAVSPSDS